jgi:hypothetical protein
LSTPSSQVSPVLQAALAAQATSAQSMSPLRSSSWPLVQFSAPTWQAGAATQSASRQSVALSLSLSRWSSQTSTWQ